MPYTDCTSLGSPTLVETASPLKLYKEYEEVAATPICPAPTRQSQDNKPLPPNPRRFSVASSTYSTDEPPQVSLQLQSWIDWSDDEDDNETLDSGYNRKIQRGNTALKRSYTTAGYNTAPLRVKKIEKEIMEMLDINEADEEAEEESLSNSNSRKSMSFHSFRPKRQSMGNLLGKLKKSLTIDQPPEWKDQIRPTYFNYMM